METLEIFYHILPQPLRDAPMRGTRIFIFSPDVTDGWYETRWVDTFEQNILLKNGVVHQYKDYCLKWVKWWNMSILT